MTTETNAEFLSRIGSPDQSFVPIADLYESVDRLRAAEAEIARLKAPTYCETFAAYGYRCEPPEETDD